MKPAEVAEHARPASAARGWRRLDPRMVAVHPIRQLGGLLPVLLILLFTGRGGGWQLWVSIAVPVVVVLSGAVSWYTTRYRVTDERVELRGGLVNREARSLRRDRVRTVDITAGPAHRLFGLSVIEIGTGSGHGTGHARLKLDAVQAAEADRLRLALLHRSPVATKVPEGAPGVAAPAATTIAEIAWSWLRFAPLTTAGLVAVGSLAAAAFNVANELGLAPSDIGAVRRAGEQLSGVPIGVGVSLLAAAVVLVATLGSVVIYIEGWWRYRLTREPDGTLLVRRGLLTTRALSVEQQRLRGAEVSEPLLLRAGRGARCSAVTTGLGRRPASAALLPPAPRAEAHRVAAAALRTEPEAATLAPLTSHPRAALRRRLTRALVPALALGVAAWALQTRVPGAWPAALVLIPIAVALGIDRYRNLGHALSAGYLVVRHGSLRRRTVAVARTGIIGWTIRQSIFQRRAGLVSLHAITAAGAGRYTATDISFGRARELAEQVNPGLLPPS